jgi:hypothetical protein
MGGELFHADDRANRHDDANSRFSQFCERAYNVLAAPQTLFMLVRMLVLHIAHYVAYQQFTTTVNFQHVSPCHYLPWSRRRGVHAHVVTLVGIETNGKYRFLLPRHPRWYQRLKKQWQILLFRMSYLRAQPTVLGPRDTVTCVYPSDNGYPSQGVWRCGQSICFSDTRLKSGFHVTVQQWKDITKLWTRHLFLWYKNSGFPIILF